MGYSFLNKCEADFSQYAPGQFPKILKNMKFPVPLRLIN